MNKKIIFSISFFVFSITNIFCWHFPWTTKPKPEETKYVKPVIKSRPEAKVIIFDFDGTLIDSLPLYLECFNKLSSKYKYEKVTDPEKFRNKNMQTVVMKELGLSLFQIPLYVKKMLSLFNKKTETLLFFEDIKNVIDQLSTKYTIGILTSNNEKTVKTILNKENIKTVNFVYSGQSIFGKHVVLKRLIKKYNYKLHDVLYVGDEVRDIKECRKANIRIAAVSWGLNSELFLKENDPNFLINKPLELVDLLIPSKSYHKTQI